ncbi:MAG TPA: DUF2520 domain-containing protein [Chitinophagaceae bacterium]|nr:DUF2520 domain-containing protein [Chitinophagaceae bacterium]
MEIVIIGTGNTATVLGRKLKAAGHVIVQVFGRNITAASELAYELESESTTYWSVITRTADLYLLAVSDIAIAEIIAELQLPDKTIVHTAASVSKNILEPATSHFGVLYPLQSLRKNVSYLPEIPVIIDASDSDTLAQLLKLAGSISETVVQAGDNDRLKLHLAAVFCNNFVNHLFVLMQEYCAAEGLNFALLKPLIHETISRIDFIDPSDAQTGPAIRHDTATIKKHEALLQNHPKLQQFYRLFTESIGQQTDL